MAVTIGSVTLTGTSTTLTVTDASSNKLYQQLSGGQVMLPTNSSGTTNVPMFNVGWTGVDGWTDLGGIVPFVYTGGSGYFNVGSCYSTSTYAFTAPWTGLYLFKSTIYCYGPDGTVYTWYFHPLFLVNGSSSARRPGGTPYRIRQYGLLASYGQDSDCCEMIYMTAGDYTQVYTPRNGTMQGYTSYSTYSGCYLGN